MKLVQLIQQQGQSAAERLRELAADAERRPDLYEHFVLVRSSAVTNDVITNGVQSHGCNLLVTLGLLSVGAMLANEDAQL